MKNIYFEDEEILTNDLYFICYMIERVARHLKQKNKYVVNTIGREAMLHLISVANGDTTRRSDVYTEFQLSIPKDDRLKGTWTLQQYETAQPYRRVCLRSLLHQCRSP